MHVNERMDEKMGSRFAGGGGGGGGLDFQCLLINYTVIKTSLT